MNRIYWQSDRIGMLTDHLNANKHAHWMLQLFLSLVIGVPIGLNTANPMGETAKREYIKVSAYRKFPSINEEDFILHISLVLS